MARRIAERTFAGGAVLVAFALVGALPAGAQSPGAGNPEPGSPSGAIYQLPVDTGRHDGAPRPDGDGSAGGTPDSTYRSDNNFGTSSVVPGDPRTKKGAGNGDGAGAGGVGAISGLAAATAAEDRNDPSKSLSLILLAIIVGVGAFLGVAASRSEPGASA